MKRKNLARFLTAIIFALIFVLASCAPGGRNAGKSTDKEDQQQTHTFDVRWLDYDHDGVVSAYDSDDTDPKLPEPYIYLDKDNSDDTGMRLYSVLIGGNGTMAFSDSRKNEFKFALTNFTNVSIYSTMFRFENNILHYSSDKTTWTYSANEHIYDFINVLNEVAPDTIRDQNNNNNILLNNLSGQSVEGNIFLLYDNRIKQSDFYTKADAAIDAFSLALQTSMNGGNYSQAIMELRSNLVSFGDIKDLLDQIRDYAPYYAYAEVYRRDSRFVSDTPMKIEAVIKQNIGPDDWQPMNAMYPGKSYTISLNYNGNCPYSVWQYIKDNMHWEIYRLGIKRNIDLYGNTSFLDLIADLFGNGYTTLQELNNSVEYNLIPLQNAGTSGFTVEDDWASGNLFKRIIILHGYCPEKWVTEIEGTNTNRYFSPRVDFLTMLPVFQPGLQLSTGPAENDGIIMKGNKVFVTENRGYPLSGRLVYERGNLSDVQVDFVSNRNQVSFRMDYTGRVKIFLVNQGDNNNMPRKSVLQFHVIDPKIEYQNMSAIPQTIILGDHLRFHLTTAGIEDFVVNNHLTHKIKNYFSDKVLGQETMSDQFIGYTNVVIKTVGTTFRYGFNQNTNKWYSPEVSTNIHAVKPEFIIKSDKASYTNGQFANFVLTLKPPYQNLYPKFINMMLLWELKSGNTSLTQMIKPYVQSNTLSMVLKNTNLNQILTAKLSYNGVSYQKSFRVPIRGAVSFTNISDGEYIYPALGGRKIELIGGVSNQIISLRTDPGGIGGFSFSRNGTIQNPILITFTGTNGKELYYRGKGVKGGTKFSMIVSEGTNDIAKVTNLTIVRLVISNLSVLGVNYGVHILENIATNGVYRMSFISSNRLHFSAALEGMAVSNQSIRWNVTSLLPQLTQSLSTNGAVLGMYVGKPNHPSYSTYHGSYTASPPISYTVKVYQTVATQTNMLTFTLEQDQRSIIRQEYYNHGITIPDYTAFSDNVSSAHFTFDEYGVNVTGYYNWIYIEPILTQRLEEVRVAMAHSLTITSCYRNPERNERVGGKLHSFHQYGVAADIRVEDWNGDGQINAETIQDTNGNWGLVGDDWYQLANLARAHGAWVEAYSDTRTWVHMDWGH